MDLISHPEIDEQFLSVLRNHTAGDPMDEKVIWTNLREKEIVKALQSDHGVQVSRRVVRQLLKNRAFKPRFLASLWGIWSLMLRQFRWLFPGYSCGRREFLYRA